MITEAHEISTLPETFIFEACAIIVTYNKVPNLYQCNLAIKRKEVNKLIIVDNSDEMSVLSAIRKKFPTELANDYVVIQNSQNLGISKAVNIGLRKASEIGCHFVYLLDDDSIQSDLYFLQERAVFYELSDAGVNVGAVCPMVSNKCEDLNKSTSKSLVSETGNAITSGLLLTSNIFKMSGGYDEEFFLEYADIEFIQRLKRLGLKVFRINKVLVCQNFGETMKNINVSTIPFVILSRVMNYIDRHLLGGNEIFHFASKYSPERIKMMYQEQKKLLTKLESGLLIRKIRTFILKIKMFLKAFLMFIAVHEDQYILMFREIENN